jgi:hypothetical protein
MYSRTAHHGLEGVYSPADMRVDIDYEAVSSDTKVKLAAVQQQTTQLKAQVRRLEQQVRRREQDNARVLELKEVQLGEKYGEVQMVEKIRQLRKEMLSTAVLTRKVRELEESVSAKDDEVKVLKSSLKYTLVKELQIEAQTYFLEARRMKKMLDKRVAAKRRATAVRDAGGGVDRCKGCAELDALRNELRNAREQVQAATEDTLSSAASGGGSPHRGVSSNKKGKQKKTRTAKKRVARSDSDAAADAAAASAAAAMQAVHDGAKALVRVVRIATRCDAISCCAWSAYTILT